MLKDRYYYPLIVVLIGAMIAYALSFAPSQTSSDTVINIQDGLRVTGPDLNMLTAPPGTSHTVIMEEGFGSIAVLSAHMSRADAPPSAGIFYAVVSQYKQIFGGQLLRLSVTARRGRQNPSDFLDMAYFVQNGGQSGWQTFALTDEFADYSFTYQPPRKTNREEIDYFGLWPDVDGQNRTVEIARMQIEILPLPDRPTP